MNTGSGNQPGPMSSWLRLQQLEHAALCCKQKLQPVLQGQKAKPRLLVTKEILSSAFRHVQDRHGRPLPDSPAIGALVFNDIPHLVKGRVIKDPKDKDKKKKKKKKIVSNNPAGWTSQHRDQAAIIISRALVTYYTLLSEGQKPAPPNWDLLLSMQALEARFPKQEADRRPPRADSSAAAEKARAEAEEQVEEEVEGEEEEGQEAVKMDEGEAEAEEGGGEAEHEAEERSAADDNGTWLVTATEAAAAHITAQPDYCAILPSPPPCSDVPPLPPSNTKPDAAAMGASLPRTPDRPATIFMSNVVTPTPTSPTPAAAAAASGHSNLFANSGGVRFRLIDKPMAPPCKRPIDAENSEVGEGEASKKARLLVQSSHVATGLAASMAADEARLESLRRQRDDIDYEMTEIERTLAEKGRRLRKHLTSGLAAATTAFEKEAGLEG